MKACKMFIALLTLMITLSGCTLQKDIYQRINEKYAHLTDYYAKCEASVHGNKTKNQYQFEVFFKSPDMTKLHFIQNDVEFIIQKDSMILKNNTINHATKLNGTKSDCMYFLIDTFFKNYYVGENASVDVSSVPFSNCTILECELAMGNDYACRQKIFIDNDTLLPKRFLTLNAKDDIVIEVDFLEFNFNDSKVKNAFE